MGRSADSIYMVMEFVEHDLKGLAESMRQPFTTAEARAAPARPRALLPGWGQHNLKGLKESMRQPSSAAKARRAPVQPHGLPCGTSTSRVGSRQTCACRS